MRYCMQRNATPKPEKAYTAPRPLCAPNGENMFEFKFHFPAASELWNYSRYKVGRVENKI